MCDLPNTLFPEVLSVEMTKNKKNRPISWAESNTSYVVEEVKKRKQPQDVSKQLTISRSQRWEPSELVITDAVMEEE